jgi:hypothetical protein
LHCRHVIRNVHHYAIGEPRRLSRCACRTQASNRCLLRASRFCPRCVITPLDLAVPDHTPRRSRVRFVGAFNHHPGACKHQYLHCVYTLPSSNLQGVGEQLAQKLPVQLPPLPDGRAKRPGLIVSVASVQYVRVPQISPYIPTPRPMSPLTPLRFYTPPNSAASRSRYSSPDGLCISIPDRRTDIPGPQTASSFALSPSCASPFPLLSVSTLVSTHNAPTPPQKAHPPSPASGYSSRSPSPVRQVRQARFSLFPHQAVQPNYPSPNIPKSGVNSVSVPPIRAMRSQTLNGTSRHSAGLRPPYSAEIIGYPKRSSSTVPPKFGTAPQPTSPPPTKTTLGSRCKYSTSHEPDSPMGTAIHNYFESNVPQAAPSRPLPALPSNAHRQRNQRVLSPSNTLRTNQSPSKAQWPAPTPPYVSRVGFLSPRDSMLTTRTARSKPLPHIGDARSSPKMVVRDLA